MFYFFIQVYAAILFSIVLATDKVTKNSDAKNKTSLMSNDIKSLSENILKMLDQIPNEVENFSQFVRRTNNAVKKKLAEFTRMKQSVPHLKAHSGSGILNLMKTIQSQNFDVSNEDVSSNTKNVVNIAGIETDDFNEKYEIEEYSTTKKFVPIQSIAVPAHFTSKKSIETQESDKDYENEQLRAIKTQNLKKDAFLQQFSTTKTLAKYRKMLSPKDFIVQKAVTGKKLKFEDNRESIASAGIDESNLDNYHERRRYSDNVNRYNEIMLILRKQTELLEKVARVLDTKDTIRSRNDFDDLLLELEKKQKGLDKDINMTQIAENTVKQKMKMLQRLKANQYQIESTEITDTTKTIMLPTVKTLIDETEIRNALKKDPYVQRIVKMAQNKRNQYVKDAMKFFSNS